MNYYLAIDIGASSGRHILGHIDNNKLVIEEIYRFNNSLDLINGYLVWDVNYLFKEIINGLKKCKELNKIPLSLGIDTWGVDFILLDKDKNEIGEAVSYRDKRTYLMDKEVYKYISKSDLYKRTGIQKQIFNTIYQLMAVKNKKQDYLYNAKHMLMIPDYFNYLLTGKMYQEYTNATTTNLINLETSNWDYELIDKLGFPMEIFKEIKKPGEKLGNLTKEIQNEIGFDLDVYTVASHDTASAVMAMPCKEDNCLFISSGTWSLMGTELLKPNSNDISGTYNFTNEGGYNYRYRFLKNIMGLWMIQSVKKEIAEEIDYSTLCKMASNSKCNSIVDCNDDRFLSPSNMADEIKNFCKTTSQKVPKSVEDIVNVVYRSLAMYYANTLKELEKITNIEYKNLYVIGGGSNADYLNKLTAEFCKLNVYAGPSEATSIGNLLCQLIANKEIKDLKEGRSIINNSFEIKEYKNYD